MATRIVSGAGWILLVSAAALAGCGGGDSNEGGGDSGKGGSSGSSSTGGDSGSAGTSTAGTDPGGTGGTSSATGGTAGKGGTTGKGGSAGTATGATGPALDRVEAACEADCNAQFALDCAPPNQNTLTCKANCAAQTAQLGDFCLLEYAELVECKADGGYECVTTYPYPRSTCASEQLAFQTCTKDLGCKRSCKKSVDESCTSMTLDACIDSCIADGAELPMDCPYYWNSITLCRATSSDASCVDGELSTPAACANSVMEVADCISDDTMNQCEGWCWGANSLGCGGADCVADCTAKSTDAMCGDEWNSMLDCALFFGDAGCTDGALMGNGICDSEATSYATCVAGPAM